MSKRVIIVPAGKTLVGDRLRVIHGPCEVRQNQYDNYLTYTDGSELIFKGEQPKKEEPVVEEVVEEVAEEVVEEEVLEEDIALDEEE